MRRSLPQYLLRYVLVVLATAIVLIPILWMASMAFKPAAEWTTVGGDVHWWPNAPRCKTCSGTPSRPGSWTVRPRSSPCLATSRTPHCR